MGTTIFKSRIQGEGCCSGHPSEDRQQKGGPGQTQSREIEREIKDKRQRMVVVVVKSRGDPYPARQRNTHAAIFAQGRENDTL